MNSTTREFLRNNLLIQLNAGGPNGVAFSTIKMGVRLASFRVSDDEIHEELAYLRDKGLAVDADKTLSPENVRTRITAEGRDYLAKEGLA